MEDRTEWPTPERIAELREQGIVSYSSRSSACIAAAVLAVAALAAPSICDLVRDLLLTPVDPFPFSRLLEKVRVQLLTWIIAPACAVTAVVAIWGLLQTRFLFRLGLVSIDFSRLLPAVSRALPTFIERLAGLIMATLVSIVSAYVLLKIVGIQLFKILHDIRREALREAISTPFRLLPVVILISILAALIFFLYEKMRFAMRNRMSRKEVLAEKQG